MSTSPPKTSTRMPSLPPLKTLVFTNRQTPARLAEERLKEMGHPEKLLLSSSVWRSSKNNTGVHDKNLATTTATNFKTNSTSTKPRSKESTTSSFSHPSVEKSIQAVKAAFEALPPLQGDNDVVGLKRLLLLLVRSVIFSTTAHPLDSRSGRQDKAVLQKAIYESTLAKISTDKQWYYRHMCQREGVPARSILSLRKFVQDEIIWYCRMYNSGLLGMEKEKEKEKEEEEVSKTAAEEPEKEKNGGDDGDNGWVKKKKKERPCRKPKQQPSESKPKQNLMQQHHPQMAYQESMNCSYCHKAGHGRGRCLERTAVLCVTCLKWGHNRNHCLGPSVSGLTLKDIATPIPN